MPKYILIEVNERPGFFTTRNEMYHNIIVDALRYYDSFSIDQDRLAHVIEKIASNIEDVALLTVNFPEEE